MIDQELIDKCEMHIDDICNLAVITKSNKRLLEQADDFSELRSNYIKLIEQNVELHKINEKHKAQLKSLIQCSDMNTGYEPSLSVFQREIDISKELISYE